MTEQMWYEVNLFEGGVLDYNQLCPEAQEYIDAEIDAWIDAHEEDFLRMP